MFLIAPTIRPASDLFVNLVTTVTVLGKKPKFVKGKRIKIL